MSLNRNGCVRNWRWLFARQLVESKPNKEEGGGGGGRGCWFCEIPILLWLSTRRTRSSRWWRWCWRWGLVLKSAPPVIVTGNTNRFSVCVIYLPFPHIRPFAHSHSPPPTTHLTSLCLHHKYSSRPPVPVPVRTWSCWSPWMVVCGCTGYVVQ